MNFSKVIARAALIAGCSIAAFTGYGSRSAAGADTLYPLTLRKADQEAVFQRGISVEGQSLEGMTLEQAKQWINDYYTASYNRMMTVTAFSDSKEYHYNGEVLKMTWNNPEILDQLSDYITDGNFVEQYMKQKDLDANPVDLSIDISFDTSVINDAVTALTGFYSVNPQDATVSRVNGEFIVTPEVIGVSYDSAAIENEMIAMLSDYSNKEDINYVLPYTEVQPQYTSANFAFSSTPLGSYATGDLGEWARAENIRLSAAGLNGTIIYPGQEVSTLALFNISAENGYQTAPGYENGQQVPALGGGVCQTTTTLYNAVLRAELTVTMRKAHSMIVTYVPPAMDATVALGGQDFKFVNPYSNPIYLESYVANGQVVINIWGVEERPANRTIDFHYTVEQCDFPNPLYVINVDDSQAVYGPTATASQKIVATVETHPAVKARSYKSVYVDGVLQSDTELNYDYYRPMSGIMYVASDCNVENSVVASNGTGVYRFLGCDMFHNVTFKNGVIWDPNFADENY